MALVFLDIDHFKRINDSLGHATGDAVLQEFASRLTRCVRSTDAVIRFAGDEFIVILEGVNQTEDANHIAEKIIAEVRIPFIVQGNQLEITTSLGIAWQSSVDAPQSAVRLLQLADEALYAAKAAGRNTYKLALVS